MPKKQTPAEDRRARAAAVQAAAARRARMVNLSIGSIVVVIVVVLALLLVYGLQHGKKTKSHPSTVSGPAPTAVVDGATKVPASVYDAVGAGTAQGAPKPLSGQPPMTENGKPRVLFIGAEYCPYCAAERWALTTALSRFGTFEGLGVTRSSSTDADPNTATLDFKDASYTSKYLTFAPFEAEDREGKPLQKLSGSDQKLLSTLGGNGFPFVDIGGKYDIAGPQYDAAVLAGLDQTQIAKKFSDADDPVTKSVIGSANLATVALCDLTAGKPASVCQSKGVLTAAAAMKAAQSKSSK